MARPRTPLRAARAAPPTARPWAPLTGRPRSLLSTPSRPQHASLPPPGPRTRKPSGSARTLDPRLAYGEATRALEGYANTDSSVAAHHRTTLGHAPLIDCGAVPGLPRARRLSRLLPHRPRTRLRPHARSRHHTRSTHTDARHHWIKWAAEQGARLVYSRIADMAGDALAKASPPACSSTSQQPPDCLLSEGECWIWPDPIARAAAARGVPCTAFEAIDRYLPFVFSFSLAYSARAVCARGILYHMGAPKAPRYILPDPSSPTSVSCMRARTEVSRYQSSSYFNS